MSKDEIRKLLACYECRHLIHTCYVLTLMSHLLLHHGMTSEEAQSKTRSVYKILSERKHHHKVLQEAL
jgi:hypothetical protein